jgi:hypothetical protein
MALQQGRQQQAMQQMAQQAAAGGGAPVPQGVPQPAPQGMAAGGLASLAPKGYRSGGVIAFSEGDLVNDDEDEKRAREEEEAKVDAGDAPPANAKAMLAQLMQEAAARRSMKPPSAESPLEARKRMIRDNPEEFGVLGTPVGQDAIKRLDELQAARRAELDTQKGELAKSRPGILQLLGQAAMGTRGQKGGSALASILGGYSELSSGAEAKQLQQEQGLRLRELELQQARAEALNKIDDLKRARAEGDVKAEQKAQLDLARITKDHNVSINTLLGRQLTTAGQAVESERKSEDAALGREAKDKIAQERIKESALDREARIKANEDRIKAENARANRPGEKERILQRLQQMRKAGDQDGVTQLLKDLRDMQGGAADVGREKSSRVAITDLLRSKRLDLKEATSEGNDVDAAAIRAEIAELSGQLKDLIPKPDTAGSVAKPIGAAEFDAKWKTLKKGQTLVGPDGKTYTKG